MGHGVHSKGKVLVVTPVLDTNAFASGDQVGVITEIPNMVEDPSGSANLVSLSILDKDKQAAIIQVLLFSDKPTVASAENAALDISDAEMAAKCVGIISVVAADYFALNANSMASIKNVNLVANGKKSATNPKGTSLWMIIRSGGSPTYSASGLVLSFGVVQA